MAVNSIDLQKILLPAAAGLEVNFFMKSLGSMDYSGKYTDEGGETINVKVHGTPTVYQTNDLTNKLSGMETKSVPLTVLPYMTGFSYTDVENTFELADKEVFLANAGKTIADEITDISYNSMVYGANQGIVVSTANASDFKVLSDAQIAINASKMEGRINGVLSSNLRGIILDTAKTNQAFSASPLADKYLAGNIGMWNGSKWADYSTTLTTIEDIFPAGTVTITNTAGIHGGTVATYTPTSSVGTALSIKAGTMFELAGVYTVNAMSKALPIKRKFIVQEDVTIPTGTGATTINIGQIFFDGALKNVSVSAISALAITNSVEADTQYYTGVAFKDTELLMGMPDLTELKGIPSSSVKSTEGLPIRILYEGSAVKSTESAILKVMFGSRAYTGKGVYSIYQKV